SIIDTATDLVVKTVTVGQTAESVGITPDGKQAYVPSFDDGLVTVIDTATQSVSTTVTTGGNPIGSSVVTDQAPVAALSVTPALVGQSTTLDASGSTVEFGTIASYAWDFGDGS